MCQKLFSVQLRLFPAHGFPARFGGRKPRENNRLSENNFCQFNGGIAAFINTVYF